MKFHGDLKTLSSHIHYRLGYGKGEYGYGPHNAHYGFGDGRGTFYGAFLGGGMGSLAISQSVATEDEEIWRERGAESE